MTDKLAPLLPDHFYHVYNRANGNEKLFVREQNYYYFLKRYKEFIYPIAMTYAFCLMPNHFHVLIQIRDENVLKPIVSKAKSSIINQTGSEIQSSILSKQFSNFFNAYAKAFNKEQNRKGNLFMRPFKRKRITDQEYLRNLVRYIHLNPVETGIASSAGAWKFSSYSAVVGSKNTIIERDQVLEWFDGVDNLRYIHNHKQDSKLEFDDIGF